MIKRFLLSFMLLIATTSGVSAVDVFGNGDLSSTANSGGNTFNANNAWALPFQTGASSAAQLTLQGAWVLVGGQTTNVSFDVSIYADAGTNQGPTGSVLATGSSTLISSDPLGWSFVTFNSPVTLNGSSNYYVAVEQATSGTGFSWYEPTTNPTFSNLGSGSAYQITGGVETNANTWRRSGGTWTDSLTAVSTNNFSVQLSTVPEPGTYALALISASVLGIYARRRRKS